MENNMNLQILVGNDFVSEAWNEYFCGALKGYI